MKGGPGGQASQLNENQGFAIAYNGGGDNADLHDLGFDVQGIGNVNNVDLTYWLYGKGADGVAGTADDVLIDTGKISIADLHLQSLNGGRYAHSVDLFAGVGANSTYAAIAGHDHVLDASDPTFDYAAVRINFPPDNGSPNPGVRVGNFSTETTHVQTPDGFSFTVSIQDVDHDIATSPTANVFLTPVLGAGWLT
jgi:hypothetical protein